MNLCNDQCVENGRCKKDDDEMVKRVAVSGQSINTLLATGLRISKDDDPKVP